MPLVDREENGDNATTTMQHYPSGNSEDDSSGNPPTNATSYGMTPEQASREFDLLRREATKLERHLEDRVARYQQLAQRLTMGDSASGSGVPSSSDNDAYSQYSSLLAVDYGVGGGNSTSKNISMKDNHSTKSSIDDEELSLSKDIQRAMATMNDLIHTKMAPAAERTGRAQHSLLVKRYREILFDCGTDYSKTSAAVSRRREARELFKGATALNGEGGGGGEEANQQLMRERNAIDNSMKSAQSVLSQAATVRSELRSQGANLRGVTGTMAQIAGHVPGLNTLIDRIRKKRQQDDRVVGGVVAMCILFTLWYLFG